LCGEQGACKTTLGRLAQRLIDPNAADLRSEPREVRDLMIAARGSWLVAYDNLSHVPQWLSDALCRLATGGGFGTRQLYTDEEEVIFNAKRPTLLASITDVVVAPDLLDRTLSLQLEPVPEEKRRTEQALWEEFETARPRILGALLDAVAAGMRALPSVKVVKLPRMADFALWAEACLRGAGFPAGTFLGAYEANRADVNLLALEASPVATVILTQFERPFTFEGTAAELLEKVNGWADEATKKAKGWPQKPNVLAGILRRAAPNLRRAGLRVEFDRDRRQRTVAIERAGERSSPSSRSSPPAPRGVATDDEGDAYGLGAGDDGQAIGPSHDRHTIVTPSSPARRPRPTGAPTPRPVTMP
jgi:hypothetical protein